MLIGSSSIPEQVLSANRSVLKSCYRWEGLINSKWKPTAGQHFAYPYLSKLLWEHKLPLGYHPSAQNNFAAECAFLTKGNCSSQGYNDPDVLPRWTATHCSGSSLVLFPCHKSWNELCLLAELISVGFPLKAAEDFMEISCLFQNLFIILIFPTGYIALKQLHI